MAYMNQEKKGLIASALKLVVPKDWKYSLSVENHSSIRMTIASAPIDLLAIWHEFASNKTSTGAEKPTSLQVNHYWISEHWPSDIAQILQSIVDALNTGNHDNSDIQTDYFDVGHYVHLNIGRWNKPFTVKGAK